MHLEQCKPQTLFLQLIPWVHTACGIALEPCRERCYQQQGITSPVNQHLIKGHADIWKSETILLCGLSLSAARLFSESLADILPD